MDVRPPAVAGSFYSNQAMVLQRDVNNLLKHAAVFSITPKAIIAPHAGYIYSGPIAASAYNTIKNRAEKINRVVLLGPSHRVGFSGVATPGCDYFETPLGSIPIDQQAIDKLKSLPFVSELPEAHAREHSLEVQLPFLQSVLSDFNLVPLVVGDVCASGVAQIIELLWGDEETLIVVSSDLSHFHPYQEAQQIDKHTTEAIEAFNCQLQGEQACGCRPVNGLLLASKKRNLQLTTLDVRNSGDTAGSKAQVVGYGAYAIH
jgi:MEMO1 family protein